MRFDLFRAHFFVCGIGEADEISYAIKIASLLYIIGVDGVFVGVEWG